MLYITLHFSQCGLTKDTANGPSPSDGLSAESLAKFSASKINCKNSNGGSGTIRPTPELDHLKLEIKCPGTNIAIEHLVDTATPLADPIHQAYSKPEGLQHNSLENRNDPLRDNASNSDCSGASVTVGANSEDCLSPSRLPSCTSPTTTTTPAEKMSTPARLRDMHHRLSTAKKPADVEAGLKLSQEFTPGGGLKPIEESPAKLMEGLDGEEENSTSEELSRPIRRKIKLDSRVLGGSDQPDGIALNLKLAAEAGLASLTDSASLRGRQQDLCCSNSEDGNDDENDSSTTSCTKTEVDITMEIAVALGVEASVNGDMELDLISPREYGNVFEERPVTMSEKISPRNAGSLRRSGRRLVRNHSETAKENVLNGSSGGVSSDGTFEAKRQRKGSGRNAHRIRNNGSDTSKMRTSAEVSAASVGVFAGQSSKPGKRKRCTCVKSLCLKLYCECFSMNLYCLEGIIDSTTGELSELENCKCADCYNIDPASGNPPSQAKVICFCVEWNLGIAQLVLNKVLAAIYYFPSSSPIVGFEEIRGCSSAG